MTTLGKVTSSQQDIVFVKVRAEDDTFLETHNGTAKTNYYFTTSVGQAFTAAKWFDRIKVKVGDVSDAGMVWLKLYDSPTKATVLAKVKVFLPVGGSVIHMFFEAKPPASYYWELTKLGGSIGVSVVTDSTIHTAYKEGSITTDWDTESKVMCVGDEIESPIAIEGDSVDSGVTSTLSGSKKGFVDTGAEKPIVRVGDRLANGGTILTGCNFMEI